MHVFKMRLPNDVDFVFRREAPGASAYVSTISPLLCLLVAVVLLSSITPIIKYLFEHTDMHPIGLAGLRVLIGFYSLLPLTLLWGRRGVKALAASDMVRLTWLGLLGVVSYAIAAWGLLYTSVTHYILIYSLLPVFTALFSVLVGREQVGLVKAAGILLSLTGCGIAIFGDAWDHRGTAGFGDGLVLLFTILMAAHIVLCSGLVMRVRMLAANTLMFGSSSLILSLLMVFLGTMGWPAPTQEAFPPLAIALVVFVGVATAAVFLLRYLSLQSLTPATVGVYLNLVPVCTIVFASLFLGEMVRGATLVGGITIMTGAELVRRT